MNTPILIILVSLGIVFLWGFLSPRTLWRALMSWSYRDPYLHEPTGFAYVLYRVVAVIGIASMVVSGMLVYRVQRESIPVSFLRQRPPSCCGAAQCPSSSIVLWSP
ncbi:MAG: hypothetical protein ABIW32_07015 [Terrimesophilobacter sp.]